MNKVIPMNPALSPHNFTEGRTKISTLMPILSALTLDQRAITTHLIQSIGTPAEAIYRRLARNFLDSKTIKQIVEFEVSWDVPFPPVDEPTFSFIDLFAGIGGMRIAFQKQKGKCVFSSEWDKFSQQTYVANFGELPFGDITKIGTQNVPKHDILVAGFPCQAFSIAGFKGGFKDTRGTLFFDVARIIQARRPRAFLLENVKGLVGHDKGRTLNVILNTLRNDLGYYVPDPQVINAMHFGVPQHRERIFIVGFKTKNDAQAFAYPTPLGLKRVIADIKEREPVPVKYYLSKQYLKTLHAHKNRHSEKGNGFGFEILDDDSVANAIIVGGMGRERNLVIDNRITDYTPTTNIKGEVNREGVRKMTPREWSRLQGFPKQFAIPVSDAQAYKQFGNSVAVPAVEAMAKQLLKAMGI